MAIAAVALAVICVALAVLLAEERRAFREFRLATMTEAAPAWVPTHMTPEMVDRVFTIPDGYVPPTPEEYATQRRARDLARGYSEKEVECHYCGGMFEYVIPVDGSVVTLECRACEKTFEYCGKD